MLKTFKIIMYEDEWNIYLVADDDDVIADVTSGAETHFESKEIYFRKGELSERTVKHELWHVAIGYCYLRDTTSLSLPDMEEINCALYADRGDKINTLAMSVYNKLKGDM